MEQGLGIKSGDLEFSDDFNWADDVAIEFFQFLGGYPILLMNSGSGLLYRKPIEVINLNLEPEYVASPAVPCIPVAGDLGCVLLIQHWVKNGLFREAWGKSAPSPGSYQLKLLLSCWPIERFHQHACDCPLR